MGLGVHVAVVDLPGLLGASSRVAPRSDDAARVVVLVGRDDLALLAGRRVRERGQEDASRDGDDQEGETDGADGGGSRHETPQGRRSGGSARRGGRVLVDLQVFDEGPALVRGELRADHAELGRAARAATGT